MIHINQFTGRLVRDPELKEMKNGKLLLNFSLAYSTRRKADAEGSHTSYLDVEIWEKLAEKFAPKLKKGMQVIIRGELVISRFKNSEGRSVSRAKLVADAIAISDLKNRPAVEAA